MPITKVPVLIGNRRVHFQDPERAEELRHYFRHKVPGAYFSDLYRSGQWDGYRKWMRNGAVPTGLYLMLKDQIEAETGCRFQETPDWKRPGTHTLAALGIALHPYQARALKVLLASPPCGGLILQATGSGKTAVMAAYFAHLHGSAVFVVDELTLLEQSRREISRITAEPVGTVGNSIFAPRRLTCATVQTLHLHHADPKFRKWFKAVEVMVIDEIHLALNKRNIQTVFAIRPKTVFGLTATLELEKEHVRFPAHALAGPVIYTYPLQQGVEEGYVAHGVACLVYHHAGPSMEDYQLAYLEQIVDSEERNQLICDLVWESYRRGHSTVLIVERVSHLLALSVRLSGIPHKVAYGGVPSEERGKIRKAVNAGKLRLVIANRVFGKGIDFSRVDVIVDGCASRSANSTIQRYGRGTRVADGKRGLIYLDVYDCGKNNRFLLASRARRLALRKAGIPVLEFERPVLPAAIFIQAEAALGRAGNLPNLPPRDSQDASPEPG